MPKIWNGELAQDGEVPWFVTLHPTTSRFEHFCGGALVGNGLVMTAAHCLEQGDDDTTLMLHAGHNDIDSAVGLQLGFRRILVHRNWDFGLELDNPAKVVGDIALIVLEEDIKPNSDIRPISVMPLAEFRSGGHETMKAYYSVSGRGKTENAARVSRLMVAHDIPSLATDICNSPDYHDGKVKGDMICAGSANKSGSDSCKGDSGSALVEMTAEGPKIVGVVSKGERCTKRSRKVGIYTKAAIYQADIEDCKRSLAECSAFKVVWSRDD